MQQDKMNFLEMGKNEINPRLRSLYQYLKEIEKDYNEIKKELVKAIENRYSITDKIRYGEKIIKTEFLFNEFSIFWKKNYSNPDKIQVIIENLIEETKKKLLENYDNPTSTNQFDSAIIKIQRQTRSEMLRTIEFIFHTIGDEQNDKS